MTSPGRYAASDGSFAKSAGSAAARGGILIGIAVLIGLLLLWQGFDGGDSDAAVGPDSTDDSNPTEGSNSSGSSDPGPGPSTSEPEDSGPSPDSGSTTTDPGPVEVDPPSSVKVAVLNGTTTDGLAGERGQVLGALGYIQVAGNAVGKPIADSKVYFTEGFADEAEAVATALSGTAELVEIAPEDPAALEDGTAAGAGEAHIIVVLGTDNALQ